MFNFYSRKSIPTIPHSLWSFRCLSPPLRIVLEQLWPRRMKTHRRYPKQVLSCSFVLESLFLIRMIEPSDICIRGDKFYFGHGESQNYREAFKHYQVSQDF